MLRTSAKAGTVTRMARARGESGRLEHDRLAGIAVDHRQARRARLLHAPIVGLDQHERQRQLRQRVGDAAADTAGPRDDHVIATARSTGG